MTDDAQIEVTVIGGLHQIEAAEWDRCACPETGSGRPIDPFTTYRFLKALEDSGSVGVGTGWEPRHVLARRDGQLIGVMPCYAKNHSQGEYIFDFNWAHAYENAGGAYYPKLQAAVPFTPATGRRFLTAEGCDDVGMSALIQGAVQLAAQNELSSIHATFCTEAEAIAGAQMGLLHRTGQQFHWYNDGYADFDGFLGALSSRKRKAIRKERRVAQGFGGVIHQFTGDQIQPEHWDAFWQFYQDTGMRKWGQPYLSREFFDIAQAELRDDILLIMCERDGHWVAGAMNLIGRDTLYGRYWGCQEDHPCLHFEVCYYQAIDYAIANGMARVEAGAQGQHKLARGYLPTPVHSLHWIADPGFRDAVARFVTAEREAVDQDIEVLTEYGPFRKNGGEDEGREAE
ncbi:GNAT family N-acetyltransferase [Amylibacter sp. IMCC11727]|uniref:GNAT family N-acetyltransferase n=1 Tax=Amylibacter sp. IMCC11727 TaxID=3039851 RepID=UPI00244E0A7E|nr:GNAT family N-acetyltransferase [Amylibacter sp. IMCC11727]WGI23576.1 GNAT family N-acetyltransferase [Amylibacter sp. IMCC11727]